jgi:hypothetical protein
MAKPRLPADLREFLKLLNVARVEYLLIGDYAVGYYGYPRATADLDIWVAMSDQNARKLVRVLRVFGFDVPNLKPQVFLTKDRIVRFGDPPLRIEILTTISGVIFDTCFARKKTRRPAGEPRIWMTSKRLRNSSKCCGQAPFARPATTGS